MADPLQNAQFLSALFAQAGAPMQRANEQKAQLALMALKRQQQMQDQAGDDSLRRELTALQIQGQKDVAEETTRRYGEMADAADRRANAKESADADKRLKAEIRAAYSQYILAGGNKPLTEFGMDEEGLSKLKLELGKQAKQTLRSKFTLGANQVRSKAARLRALVDDPSLDKEATQSAVSTLATQGSGDDVERAIKTINAGDLNVGLKLLSPQNRALFDNAKRQAATSLRALKYKDPNVVGAIRGLQDDQDALTKLINSSSDLNAKDVEDLSALLPNLEDELGVKPAQTDLSKYFGTGGGTPNPKTTASSPSTQKQFGGLRAIPSMLPDTSFAEDARDYGLAGLKVMSGAGIPAGLNYLWGGLERVKEGDAERTRQLMALRQLAARFAPPTPDVNPAMLPGYFPQ